MDWKEIKKKREKMNLTQIEVARAVGVSLMGFRIWEMGAGKPKAENLVKLKEVLSEQATEQ